MLRACLFPASVLTVIALLVASCPVALVRPAAARPAAQPPDGVVISQVFAGGGGNDAPFRSEYVELFNAGDASVNLAGWSAQDASARGATWTVTPLTGSIAPGGYFLVVGPAAVWGAALPTPDIVGSFELGTSGGKVALVEDTTPLACNTAAACAAAAGVRDLIGYGQRASAYEGSGPALAPGGVRAVVRLRDGCLDHNDNARDLDVGIAAPRSSADPPHACGPEPVPDCGVGRIRDIQGAAFRSPAEGCAVSEIEGVVTALLGNGFYMQDPAPDADPATSEGLLVFLDAAPDIKVKDIVRVAGTVVEFRPGSDGGITNLATTELDASAGEVAKVGTVAELPAPIVLGVDRVPPTSTWSGGGVGDIERGGSFDPDAGGLAFYESLEGMRVRLDGAVVLEAIRGAPIPVLPGDGSGATGLGPRGALVGTVADENPERLVLADALEGVALPPAVEVGDRLVGPLDGIVHYDRGRWTLRLTASPRGPLDTVTVPEQAVPAGPGELAMATMNVENLAFDDPALTASEEAAKFAAVAREVVAGLGSPDLIVLQEMQDDNGSAIKADDPGSGVLTAQQTATRLTDAIVAAGGPVYAYRDVPPTAVDADGGQPRGNIRIAFLYRTDRGLALADRGGPGASDEAVDLVIADGELQLSANPARIAPDALAFEGSRKPLVGEFTVGERTLFVVGNHFSSKSGGEPNAGRFRLPHEEGAAARALQAEEVAAFVAQILAEDPDALVVVLGDFNDFPDAVALGTLTSGGLTNLVVDEVAAGDRYSTIFEGSAQQIDHILVSAGLAALVVPGSGDVVHLNAEFAVRASDHDPVVVRFALGG